MMVDGLQTLGGLVAPSLDIDPFDEQFLSDPYTYHAEIRDGGAVVWLPRIGAYGIARFAEVQGALRDHANFCSARGVGLSDFAIEQPWRAPSLLLETDPPIHDRTRGLMNRIVSLRSLRELRPVWAEKARKLVDALIERRSFDAVADLGEAFPMAVFPDTIGVPEQGREQLLPYATAVFNAFGPRNAIFERGNELAAGAAEWVANACKRSSLSPGSWGMAVYEASD